MTVSITKTNLSSIDKDLEKALTRLDYKPTKNKILIKPNLVYATDPKSGIITHPRVVEAVVKYLKQFNCEIIIAEGSAVGHNTIEVFKKTGYKKLAEKYHLKLLDLNTCERIEHKWKYGTIKLPKILEECEYINIPTLKTHTITGVTLGTKNQKGLLDYNTKKQFHTIGVNESVRELANVIQPSLTIINALYCLEGNSVSIFKSKGKNLNLLIIGKNMFEVDNIGLKITGIKEEIKHFPIIPNIETIGEKLESVQQHFSEAQKIRRIFNMEFQMNGCSGCSVNMEQALKLLLKKPLLLAKFFYLAKFKNITFVSGFKLKQNLRPNTKVVYIGKCTKCISKDNFIYGCPPEPKDIIEAIKKL